MHLQSLIAGVGLVATTNALLVPPEFSITDDAVATLPVPIEIDADVAVSQVPDTQTVMMPCPGCLQLGRKHHKEIPSHLKLDFSIESTDGADRLTLNGYELYPHPDPLRNILKAPVLPDMASRRVGAPPRFRGGPNRPQRNRPLGFSMETGAVATDDDEDLQLISVKLQIIEVGNVFVDGIPMVQVKLVKTPSGKLAIGTIDAVRAANPQFKPEDDMRMQMHKECASTLCKWKALFYEKLSHIFALKGCGSSSHRPPPPHHGGLPPPPPPPSFPHHGPPPPPPPHRHHHHDGEHRHGHGPRPSHMGHGHGWGHGAGMFVTRILFPVLIGIVAGISASIIGMMIGTFVVFIWRTFFRRHSPRSSHRCRYAHKAARSEAAADEEKSGLLADQEGVEAPPAYVESNVVVTDDKKPEDEA
ncbi:hypothetical protein GGR51DRAFT_508798 [Nemania sp. FL0031]|nr:hypothetical protein GGR51DRAFT_508798 [Nemania sp. FL0031]